jgi:hypothetical protein
MIAASRRGSDVYGSMHTNSKVVMSFHSRSEIRPKPQTMTGLLRNLPKDVQSWSTTKSSILFAYYLVPGTVPCRRARAPSTYNVRLLRIHGIRMHDVCRLGVCGNHRFWWEMG